MTDRTILSLASPGDTHPTAGQVPLGSPHTALLEACFSDSPREPPSSDHPGPGRPARPDT